MLYNYYELQRTMLSGAAAWASITSELISNPATPFGYFGMGQVLSSALDVFAHASAPRGKPAFDIEAVKVDGKTHRVTESIMLHKPFANLLHFTHEGPAGRCAQAADRRADERALRHFAARHRAAHAGTG